MTSKILDFVSLPRPRVVGHISGTVRICAEIDAVLSSRGFTTRQVRGDKIQSLASAHDELAAALQFPWYYGENLDALHDCLTDLSWLRMTTDLVLIVRSANNLLRNEQNDLSRLLRVFIVAMDY